MQIGDKGPLVGGTGIGSRIVSEFASLGCRVERLNEDIEQSAERFILAAGTLTPANVIDQSDERIAESMAVNFIEPMRICERILSKNSLARIVVIGSESGFNWSHDGVYAGAKAALHRYVETRKLIHPKQQIVCISPGIIGDCGMTIRREDTENLKLREASHPKWRFLTAKEVAKLAWFLLFVDSGYICNQVIRMNGGENAR